MDVTEICTQVDDISGEIIGDLTSQLLAAGALDVWLSPIVMKKGRPGTQISLLCQAEDCERLAELLLSLSGSFGCRFRSWQRMELERDWQEVATEFGKVRIKQGRREGRLICHKPEFSDCQNLAEQAKVPTIKVWQAAISAMSELKA